MHLKAPNNDWVERAIHNFEEGYVNEELLTVLTEMTIWKAEYDRKRHYERFKRLFDICGSLILIFLVSPVLILCAIAIKFESKGPVFFRQLRSGKFGQPFWILKFRTMPINLPKNVHYLKPLEKPTIPNLTTKVGKFLRDHKLDELPQLWNCLIGDMSLVGPRPLSMNDTSVVHEKYYPRFSIRPGMTGLWQATISNDAVGDRKLLLDTIYVKKRTFSLDMFLLMRTFLVVFQGENRFTTWKRK